MSTAKPSLTIVSPAYTDDFSAISPPAAPWGRSSKSALTEELKRYALSEKTSSFVIDCFRTSSPALYLPERALSAIPPAILGYFTSLNEVNLRGNHIDEPPSALFELPHLLRLVLSHNAMKKLPPIESSSLEELDVAYNQLDQIPLCFAKKLSSSALIYAEGNPISSSCISLFYQTVDRTREEEGEKGPECRFTIGPVEPPLAALEEALTLWCERAKETPEYTSRLEAKERILATYRDKGMCLSLSDLGLSNLPEILGDLKRLRWIDVSKNALKQLPASFATLPVGTLVFAGDNSISPHIQTVFSCVIEGFRAVCPSSGPEILFEESPPSKDLVKALVLARKTSP